MKFKDPVRIKRLACYKFRVLCWLLQFQCGEDSGTIFNCSVGSRVMRFNRALYEICNGETVRIICSFSLLDFALSGLLARLPSCFPRHLFVLERAGKVSLFSKLKEYRAIMIRASSFLKMHIKLLSAA